MPVAVATHTLPALRRNHLPPRRSPPPPPCRHRRAQARQSSSSSTMAAPQLQLHGERTSGMDVRQQNATAVLAVANILKTSLGPVGLDKVRPALA